MKKGVPPELLTMRLKCIAETIQTRPVISYWPHMQAQLDADVIIQAAGEIDGLRAQVTELQQDCARLFGQRDGLIERSNRIVEENQRLCSGLEAICDRYLLALGKGEAATGDLVVQLASYAKEALTEPVSGLVKPRDEIETLRKALQRLMALRDSVDRGEHRFPEFDTPWARECQEAWQAAREALK